MAATKKHQRARLLREIQAEKQKLRAAWIVFEARNAPLSLRLSMDEAWELYHRSACIIFLEEQLKRIT
jgi:hypothetical protein